MVTSTGASPVLDASTMKCVGFPGNTLSGSSPGPYASTLLALGFGLPSLVTHGTLNGDPGMWTSPNLIVIS